MSSEPHAATEGEVALTGETLPPELERLVADYVLVHFEPTQARIEALFTPDLQVYGSTLPPRGLDREGYVEFLRKLYGTVFRQAPNTRVFRTHDGRIVLRWTLSAGPRQIAAGLDYLTIRDGRVSRIVGLY